MTDTTLESVRRWMAAYENHDLSPGGETTMRFARAYVAAETDNARLCQALDRYRYAVEWVAADSWDHCSDCRERLEWARAMDAERLTADQIAAIGKKFLGITALSPPAVKPGKSTLR